LTYFSAYCSTHPKGQKNSVENFNLLSFSLAVIRKAAKVTFKTGHFERKIYSLTRNSAIGYDP